MSSFLFRYIKKSNEKNQSEFLLRIERGENKHALRVSVDLKKKLKTFLNFFFKYFRSSKFKAMTRSRD